MTEANIEPRTRTVSEFSEWGKELERLAQEGLKKEIAKHKAAGNPIFYTRIGVPIMELPDSRCFEYQVLEDGTRNIVRDCLQKHEALDCTIVYLLEGFGGGIKRLRFFQ